jgi:hypothetical protein
VTIPPQGVKDFILFDPCLPSWWWLLTGLHLMIHPPCHTLNQYRQLSIELIILKLLLNIHVVPSFVFLGFAILIGRNKSLLMLRSLMPWGLMQGSLMPWSLILGSLCCGACAMEPNAGPKV